MIRTARLELGPEYSKHANSIHYGCKDLGTEMKSERNGTHKEERKRLVTVCVDALLTQGSSFDTKKRKVCRKPNSRGEEGWWWRTMPHSST